MNNFSSEAIFKTLLAVCFIFSECTCAITQGCLKQKHDNIPFIGLGSVRFLFLFSFSSFLFGGGGII